MDLISIIVPVYNVEPYLRRCLDSIINQTYTNLEIIVVNDGSTDSCPTICDYYAEIDERIRVIHKVNGGLSDARNAGLREATGDYIAFVDSDDWISTRYIEVLFNQLEISRADIVECNFLRTTTDITMQFDDMYQTETFDAESALEELILDRKLHQVVWNKLYRRYSLNKCMFEVGKYNEDEFWTYQIFSTSKKIIKIEPVLYFYYQNNTSIMGQGYQLKRLDAIEAKQRRQKLVDKQYPNLSNTAATNLMDSIIYAGQMSMKYLSSEEKGRAMQALHTAVEQSFLGTKQYEFCGSVVHRIWNRLAIRFFVPVCKVRNILHINV